MPKGIYTRKESTKIAMSIAAKKRIRKPFTISAATRLKMSLLFKGKPRLDQRGDNSGKWKGDNIGYSAAHSYLRKHHSDKKKFCVHCGCLDKLHFAKIHDRKYTRYIEDYLILCVKCHRKYDLNTRVALDNLSKTYSHRNPIQNKLCEYCSNLFKPAKKTIRFCSNTCSSKYRCLSINKK